MTFFVFGNCSDKKRKVSWWMLFFLNAIFVFIQSLISFGWKVASDTKALIEFAVCSSKVHIVIAEGDRREMPVPLNRDIGVKEVVEGTKKGVNLEYGIEEGVKNYFSGMCYRKAIDCQIMWFVTSRNAGARNFLNYWSLWTKVSSVRAKVA